MTAKTLELHQTLHGYSDGHQLLSSSLRLTREQQWQMLVMSDLSGPSSRTGFDSYLTGYPLDAGGFYCLARTWLAPELPRPGCVWTHTILISETDVAQVQDFRSILSHFRRPSSNEDVQAYQAPIYDTFSTDQPYHADPSLGALLLCLLYDSPSRRVVLTSESSPLYDDLLLGVLSQQWPRLRRNFKFCTGALGIRDVDFDLAVAPPYALRQDTDAQKTMTVAASDAPVVAEQCQQDWVRIALNDLLKGSPQTALRRFLWKFGPDYSDGRSAFRPLCEIHLASSLSSDSVEQVLSAVAHFFPEADSSKRLKAEFFGIGGVFSHISSRGEYTVLRALVTHPAGASIPRGIASIEHRAAAFVKADDESAIQIATVASSIGGSRADEYLDGFAAGIGERPELLHRLSSSLIFDVFKRYPSLLTSPESWRGSIDHQLAVASYVASRHDLAEYSNRITRAVLAANAWASLASILAHFGHEAVVAILEWVDTMSEHPLSPPDPVFNALAERRSLVVDVIQQKPMGAGALRVVSGFLDPRADRVRALGTGLWVSVTNRDTHLASARAELHSRAFLLSLGLSLSGEGDVSLLRAGFSSIYDAARDELLDDETWSFLDPYLPWYLVTWDRCARLIRGAVRLFLERRWPATEFLSTFRSGEQFQRALGEADTSRRGSRYIKKICDLVSAGSLVVDQAHADILRQYCR
jgi:hypothetical protein